MSIRLPTTDLTGKVAGNSGSVTWTGQHISPALATQMYGAGTAIQVYNESGCGLNITFQGDTSSSFIPAGGWRVFTIGPDIQQYTWTVDYVLPNAPVNHLITVWYAPGEQVDETGFLGNSPIGVSAVPVSVSQVINDGNPLVSVVVEATPAGGSSSLKFNNDGSGYFSGGIITFDNNGNFKCGNGSDSSSAGTPALLLASDGTLLAIYNNPGDTSWSWVPQSSGGAARGSVFYGIDAANTLHAGVQIAGPTGNVTIPNSLSVSGNTTLTGVTATNRLISGNQETGVCGTGITSANTLTSSYFVCNFKNVMTNTPSSITLTTITSSNVSSGPSVDNIDQYGFLAHVNWANSIGNGIWFGTYATVGN